LWTFGFWSSSETLEQAQGRNLQPGNQILQVVKKRRSTKIVSASDWLFKYSMELYQQNCCRFDLEVVYKNSTFCSPLRSLLSDVMAWAFRIWVVYHDDLCSFSPGVFRVRLF